MKLKVRQISQGVEDLNWRPQLATHDQKDEEMQEGEVPQESTTDIPPPGDKEDAEISEISTPEEAPSPPDIQMSKSVPNIEKSHDMGHAVLPDVMADSDTTGPSPPASRPRSHSDGAEKDKAGVKRKHSERGTSQAPPEAEEPLKDGEVLKRPRDEAEGDENPRETKRPTPPPESKSGRTSPPSPKVPKLVCTWVVSASSTLTNLFACRVDSWRMPHQALPSQTSRGKTSLHRRSRLPLVLRYPLRLQPRQCWDRDPS
jgi:Ran-binding protein 3